MLDVTWEWIAIDKAALDVANTVAVERGVEHDLLAPAGEFERWAAAAAASAELEPDAAAAIDTARPRILRLREHVRAVLKATAVAAHPPATAIDALNAASRAAPRWPELGRDGLVVARTKGSAIERLLAAYARSAIEIAGEGSAQLRICPAPSCGMFYRPRRRQQRWCSEPCGNRARFARHYRARRKTSRSLD